MQMDPLAAVAAAALLSSMIDCYSLTTMNMMTTKKKKLFLLQYLALEPSVWDLRGECKTVQLAEAQRIL